MNNGDTFIFFPTFIEQAESIKSDKVQLALYKAIANYGSYGELPDFTDIDPVGMLDAVFLPIKLVIDNAKEERERKQKAGKSGGAPMGNKNASKNKQKQAETSKNKENNLNKNNNKYNNILKRESVKEKAELSLSTNKHALEDCDENLLAWMQENNVPYILSHYTHLVSSTELAKLKEKYSTKRIMETIGQVENNVLYRKRYTNLYRVLINWLRKEAHNG